VWYSWFHSLDALRTNIANQKPHRLLFTDSYISHAAATKAGPSASLLLFLFFVRSKTLRWRRRGRARVCVELQETYERHSYGDKQPGISIRHKLVFTGDETRQSIWNRVDSREPMGPRGQVTRCPSPFPLNQCLIIQPTGTALKRQFNKRDKTVTATCAKEKGETLPFRCE
jgi:hypothetical protein